MFFQRNRLSYISRKILYIPIYSRGTGTKPGIVLIDNGNNRCKGISDKLWKIIWDLINIHKKSKDAYGKQQQKNINEKENTTIQSMSL